MFSSLGDDMNYEKILQLDGALSVCHINYGKSPVFNGKDSRNLCVDSRENSITSKNHVDDVIKSMHAFDGTEDHFSDIDRIDIWRRYWEEYTNAFDRLTSCLPDSVVTAYIGRHAIELGFKYLLLKKTNGFNS